MGAKQDIVIKHEFTVRGPKGGGSRGATPGEYVLRYMARGDATEDLTPVRRFEDDSLDILTLRYHAKKHASDPELVESVEKAREEMHKVDGYGGKAFGYGQISLSEEALKDACKDIQTQFDNGKTVFKTVLSFDDDYLKKMGLVDEDFVCENKGDYRGNLDQMKLRMAIMNGMRKMSMQYDDMQYVGVIQVDTKHVHCHLAMVDRGLGNLRFDGEQKGMLNKRAMRDIRNGIDWYLDENQTVAHMHSNVDYDKRNEKCFVKKLTHTLMDKHGAAQFLIACLPEDRTKWRAKSHDKEMQKPNKILRDYVEQVLAEPNSGYKEAMRDTIKYAEYRREREGLSFDEYQRLVDNGREDMIKGCMNGVYSVLKQIPQSEMSVRTPMMDVMSIDYGSIAARAQEEDDDMITFGFRLRSYTSRLDHHRKEMHKYHELKENYDSIPNASESSRVMRDFYEEEEEYNAKLMCKYQHFLSFLPPSDSYTDEFVELMDYKHKMESLEKMMHDTDIKRFQSDETAEDYGIKVYGQHGGQYVKKSPDILERRLEKMQDTYKRKEDDFKFKISDYGMTLDDRGVSYKKPYEFDEVKALDIHHLSYDFHRDVDVSYGNVRQFIDYARKRQAAYDAAAQYLTATGQAELLKQFPGRDISLMTNEANQLEQMPVVVSATPVVAKKHGAKTVRLDRDFTSDMHRAVTAMIVEENDTAYQDENRAFIQYGEE